MAKLILIFLTFFIPNLPALAQRSANPDTYLSKIKTELTIEWPDNRTINLVFHGHSVPAGFWHDHEVHTLESYPYLVLRELKKKYPYAVINVIVTAIGGENSLKGAERMDAVLAHRPNVLFIDYALNDRFADRAEVREAWAKMIAAAQENNVPVILLTPSPDQRVDILAPGNPLAEQSEQIRELAQQNQVGLADAFARFQELTQEGKAVADYMSHVNHPNQAGHQVIVREIIRWF